MDFKAAIAQEIIKALGESPLSQQEIAGFLEVPPDTKMGDYAFPCFKLARSLRKAPPPLLSVTFARAGLTVSVIV